MNWTGPNRSGFQSMTTWTAGPYMVAHPLAMPWPVFVLTDTGVGPWQYLINGDGSYMTFPSIAEAKRRCEMGL